MTLPCYESCDSDTHNAEDLKRLQELPLEDKVRYSMTKIREFYLKNHGKVYISFSGGKDSTVLLHLVRSKYVEVPAVFFDTGLEFPEIRDHVRSFSNVELVRPDISFRHVIDQYGYPVIGKEIAKAISLAQRGHKCGMKRMSTGGRYGYERYSFMVEAPFKVSDVCCYHLKKKPAHQYAKKTGRSAYIGTRVDESQLRKTKWIKLGDNKFDSKEPSSTPLSIWTNKDVNEYIRTRNLTISPIYSMGYERTGCAFCMFGIMQHKERFQILRATHPKLWAYCMKAWDEGGLGMAEVLEYMSIPTGKECSLVEWIK